MMGVALWHICLKVLFYFKCVYIYTYMYILLLLHRSAVFAVKNTELRTEKEI